MGNEFEDHLMAKDLSEKTIKQYMKHLRLFEHECVTLNQQAVNKFVSKHPTFVARAFLKNLFEWFVQNGLTEDKVPKIQKPTGFEERLPKEVIADKYFIQIRKHLLEYSDYKFVLMYDLSDMCGLRREEVVNLAFDSFFWDIWEKSDGLRLKVYAKGKERIVIVPPKLAERIVKYCVRRASELPSKSKPLFKIKVSRWHQVFKKAVRKTTKKNITLHDLRRRRATKWLNHGVDLDEVRRRLGHSDLSTTQKYLIRDEEERLKKWEKYDE